MVPDNSTRIPRVPAYSGGISLTALDFAYTALTSYGRPFQTFPLSNSAHSSMLLLPREGVATSSVWAPPRSLATTGGIVFTFFSCRYLDVSVPCVRFRLCRMTQSLAPGCPIRISAALRVFAPPRGFSQLITSFFASESQGIPHAPFSHFVISLSLLLEVE